MRAFQLRRLREFIFLVFGSAWPSRAGVKLSQGSVDVVNCWFSSGLDGDLGAAMLNSGVDSSSRLVGQGVSLELQLLLFSGDTFIHLVLQGLCRCT